MNTLDYLLKKYSLSYDVSARMPVEIPDVGRDMLAEWLNELDFKTGVEIGVATGAYSEVLCRANPQMKLYGVDPYIPLKGYKDYSKTSTLARFKEEAEA